MRLSTRKDTTISMQKNDNFADAVCALANMKAPEIYQALGNTRQFWHKIRASLIRFPLSRLSDLSLVTKIPHAKLSDLWAKYYLNPLDR